MSELFSIKQEPELDIVSDNEGPSGIRIDTESIVTDNDANTRQVRNSYCFCSNKKTVKILIVSTAK